MDSGINSAGGTFEAAKDNITKGLKGLVAEAKKAGDMDVPALDDPLKAAQKAFDRDPETTKHTALLHAWHGAFGDVSTTVSGAVRRVETDDALQAALDEIGGQGQRINPRIVGRWIERHVGRRIGELRFERGSLSRGLATWTVKCDAPTVENKPTKGTTPTTSGTQQRANGPADGGFGGSGGFVSDHGRAALAADEEAI